MEVNAIDLVKNYQLGETTVQALRGLNMVVREGEFTAVVGASGSGKTTLLNIVGCIDSPDSGAIEIDGIAVHRLSENEKSRFRNSKIGFIFQSFNLLPVLTVFENIELPLVLNPHLSKNDRRLRVEQWVEEVGLTPFRQHRPDQLSGGQRQRVAIARALVTQPKLILADEPTANLDSQTAHKIIDLMIELNRKHRVTFLFSTHDEKLMSRVMRVIRMQDGQIQETSP